MAKILNFSLRLNWNTPDTSILAFDVTDAPLGAENNYRLVIPGCVPAYERDFPTIRKSLGGTRTSSDGVVLLTEKSAGILSIQVKGGGGTAPYGTTALATHFCPKISDASVVNLGVERVVSVKDSTHDIRLILETADWEPTQPGVSAKHKRGRVVFDNTVTFKWDNIKGVLGKSTSWSEKK